MTTSLLLVLRFYQLVVSLKASVNKRSLSKDEDSLHLPVDFAWTKAIIRKMSKSKKYIKQYTKETSR